MRLRQFNERGIARFREMLEHLRADPHAQVPFDLLEDDAYTVPVEPEVELERPGFVTKGDAAHYLFERLAPVPEKLTLRSSGLWSWLTLFFFDDICPPTPDGRRVVADYYYVYEADQGLYHYRHILRVSYEIRRRAPQHNRLFLNSPVTLLGTITERVMRRLFLTRIPCIFDLMERLYYDPQLGRAKKGIAEPRPRRGDLVNRLPVRVRQLQKTFDLNVLDADQLLHLLGDEFQPWLDQPSIPGLEH